MLAKKRRSGGLLFTFFALRPGAFPGTPQSSVTEAKLVPPKIEHLLIEMQNPHAGNMCGGRNEEREAIVHAGAFRVVHAREQVPQSKCVAAARLLEHDGKLRIALCDAEVFKIELVQ